MGNRPDAYLVYGYKLGDQNGWQIQETTGGYGSLDPSRLSWVPKREPYTDEEGDTDDYGDESPSAEEAIDAANELLKMCLGDSVKIEIISGSDDGGGYYLITQRFHTDWDGDLSIDMMASVQQEPKMNTALKAALRVLKITPHQSEPTWLLVATY